MPSPSSPLARLSELPGWELLQTVQQQASDLSALNHDLRRRGVDADLANALTAQIDLRRHARAKFGERAAAMLFTREGLEQASRLSVATVHARRFAAAGIARVADLGCGIGSESLALALAGLEVRAVDLDADAVICARANLRDFPSARVETTDLTTLTTRDLQGWGAFLDPARRGPRGRRFKPEDWAPPWNHILEMTTWGLPMGVKVAPGIDYSYLPGGHHVQWLSVGGALVEASLWTPGLAPEGPGRSAALLADDSTVHTLIDPAVTDAATPPRQAKVGPLDDYLFEPDPAVIRSGTLAELAERTGTTLISPRLAYLTGPSPAAPLCASATAPFLTGFRVLGQTALRVKAIRSALRELNAGRVEVKKRGADIDPDALHKQLQGDGECELVVFATRVGAAHRAIIATRDTQRGIPEGGSSDS